MSLPLHELFKPALEPARTALRSLDADQVPNDLRRVAGSTGGSLPPPLAAALVRGLDQYGWLRDKTLEHMGPAVEDGGRREAADLFLRRPDGWALRLAGIASAEGELAARRDSGAAESRAARLGAELDRARTRLKDQRREADATIAALERRVSELGASARAERAAEARQEQGIRRALADAERAAGEALRERVAAEEAAAAAREAARRERRRRRRAEEEIEGGRETGVWVADDPEALADRLDLMSLMARPPAPAPSAAEAPAAAGRVRLPAGTSPDTAAAIEWVVRGGEPLTVIVDGYNAGFRLTGDRQPRAARDRLAPVLERLATLSAGRARVVVVYDSGLGAADEPAAPGPVSVRFTEAGWTADEEIVDLARRLAGTVVVITGDREVRESAEAAGAVPLWSSALTAWARRR